MEALKNEKYISLDEAADYGSLWEVSFTLKEFWIDYYSIILIVSIKKWFEWDF